MGARGNSDDRATWRQFLRYRFDNLLARGTWAVLLWLGVVTFTVVLIASFLLHRAGVSLSGSENAGWFEDFWQSLLRTLDSGTMAGDNGWRQRLVAMIVTLFGLLVLGTLIGVIASGVEAQIDRMKRGRSAVVESDHIVVLGASTLLPDVVDQLLRANIDAGLAIVVMADRDPSEVSDEVRAAVEHTFGNRLVFRAGDPTLAADLELVRLGTCRTVVVLNADGAHIGDARAVHTVLAVVESLGGHATTPIVVVLDDAATAQTVATSFGPAVHPIVVRRAVSRNAAFTLREQGLGQVMSEITDFRGADIYVRDLPGVVGTSFGDLLLRYRKARPIGRMTAAGRVELNPAPEMLFEHGDRLVLIADNWADPAPTEIDTSASPVISETFGEIFESIEVRHILVIGWSEVGRELLHGWAMTAAPGSTVEVIFDADLIAEEEIDAPELDGIEVAITPITAGIGAISSHSTTQPTMILLLAYLDHLPPEEVDSRTLLQLMTLRQDFAKRDLDVPRLVIELMSLENAALAHVRPTDDVLVTPAIASRFLAQLTDAPERLAVFQSLYEISGPTVHLVPVEALDLVGEVTMHEIVRRSYARGLLAFGWRPSPSAGGNVVLNASEDERIALVAGDEIVVIG